jgi:hypothetical protein
MTRTRQNKLTVFLDDEELAMLKAESERTGLSQSDVVRQHIRKGHNENSNRQQRQRATPRKARG